MYTVMSARSGRQGKRAAVTPAASSSARRNSTGNKKSKKSPNVSGAKARNQRSPSPAKVNYAFKYRTPYAARVFGRCSSKNILEILHSLEPYYQELVAVSNALPLWPDDEPAMTEESASEFFDALAETFKLKVDGPKPDLSENYPASNPSKRTIATLWNSVFLGIYAEACNAGKERRPDIVQSLFSVPTDSTKWSTEQCDAVLKHKKFKDDYARLLSQGKRIAPWAIQRILIDNDVDKPIALKVNSFIADKDSDLLARALVAVEHAKTSPGGGSGGALPC